MNEFLTPARAIEFLREQGYPLPMNAISARAHLLRLGNRELVKFNQTAGRHRRYREADLLEFLSTTRNATAKTHDPIA